MFFYLGVFAMATPALLYSFPRLFREPDGLGRLGAAPETVASCIIHRFLYVYMAVV
jgi:hypothetical protein